MGFGQNVQFLRKMVNKMTQEDLAEKMQVSRQTVSKWEQEDAFPDMEHVIALCDLFSCSMDQLLREDMNLSDDAYSEIRIECVDAFRYLRYAVISAQPEEDAKQRVRTWARTLGAEQYEMIGWDFPFVSQEQVNVFHMHGYTAALILTDDMRVTNVNAEIVQQEAQNYLVVTIREPFSAPFRLIPNAYKLLYTYMNTNHIAPKRDQAVLSCFEKEYERGATSYMDIYIAIE